MRGLGQYCACLEMLVIKKTNSTPSQMQQLITNLTEMLYVLLALSFQSVLVVASTEQYQNYELTRTKLAKTMDGLEVQYRILKSSYGTSWADFISSARSEVVKEMVDMVLFHKESWADAGQLAVRAVLESVTRDACAYLTEETSDWYDNFNCSRSQLQDMASQIALYTRLKSARRALRARHFQQEGLVGHEFECNYWNSHVLLNCSVYTDAHEERGSGSGSGVAAAQSRAEAHRSLLQMVQEQVLQVEYSGSSDCRLCEIA